MCSTELIPLLLISGGVFIATFSGLILAMILLGLEVMYHRKKSFPILKNKRTIKGIYEDIITEKEFGLGFNKKVLRNDENVSYQTINTRNYFF